MLPTNQQAKVNDNPFDLGEILLQSWKFWSYI